MMPRADRLRALVNGFRERTGREPQLFSAPGRVNLIGEHTDYNGGFVLPIAIEERTFVAAAPRTDRVIVAHSLELGEELSFSLDEPWHRRHDWLDYVEGVARALLRDGVAVGGAELAVTSEVPVGAGLSSSAALELAVGLALSTLTGAALDARALARAGQTAENEFVGVRSGAMDQLASALGREGHALLIDCRSLEVTAVAIPAAPVELVIADTGVRHALAASGYNQRRDECERALALLAVAGLPRSSLRDVLDDELDAVRRLLPEALMRRVRHVVTENARTAAAADALREGHFETFGRLMLESHASLRDDYEVSVPELDHLVATAEREPGVLGARMTGGGFGGSVILLVKAEATATVQVALAGSFSDRFGKTPSFRGAKPSMGARAGI